MRSALPQQVSVLSEVLMDSLGNRIRHLCSMGGGLSELIEGSRPPIAFALEWCCTFGTYGQAALLR